MMTATSVWIFAEMLKETCMGVREALVHIGKYIVEVSGSSFMGHLKGNSIRYDYVAGKSVRNL